MTDTQMNKRSEFIHNAVDYIDELKGDDWQIGGRFAIGYKHQQEYFAADEFTSKYPTT